MKQIFINKFEKGSTENANLGMGNIVGIDVASKKGVARLAKKQTYTTTNFTSYPTFVDFSQSGTYTWVQCADGSVLYSADGGGTFQATNTAFPVAGSGNGMIFFQGFMFAFTDTKIYYWKNTGAGFQYGDNPTSGAWVDWTAQVNGAGGTLQAFGTDPIMSIHFPFLYPNNRGVYFGNGGAGGTANALVPATDHTASSSVGFFGQFGTTPFNPAGARGTDFLWDNGILQLPFYTWTVGSINFLPPSKLAISVSAYQNPAQGSDIITWDTVSSNKFDPPLRIFSDINANGAGISAGIKQLYNRNQVLYAVTGGNHSIYETNGSSFNLLEDIGLYSNIRGVSGAEVDLPVFFNSYPSAITVIGNKLFSGIAPMTNTATYPATSTGFFPFGVWSIAFDKDGSHSTQCEFSVSPLVSSNVSPVGTNRLGKVTCLKPINTVSTSTGKMLIGFAYNSALIGASTIYGVSIVDLYKYNDDIVLSVIESELFEIGTYLSPKQIGNIEVNFIKKLKTGQIFDLAYRTGIESDWTNIPYEGTAIVTGDNTKNSYSYTSNAIGQVQFIQFRFRMATDSGNATNSPELRTIIINPLDNN
jgi:hypothetical protein